MWFHKDSKQAFLFPPKTGSTSSRLFLYSLGWKCLAYQVSTASDLIDKYPNLTSYSIYGFLRDPLARFESSILHIKQVHPQSYFLDELLKDKPYTRETISYEELIDLFPNLRQSPWGVFFYPQHRWFDAPNVTALDFENMEAELRRITGNTDMPIDRKNVSTDFGRSVITQKVKDFVREYYADDYALIKDRLGKEY